MYPDIDRGGDPISDRRDRFEQIVEQVFDPLQRYLIRRARPQDAEDVLSDVLLVIWRRLDAVPDGDPLPWCYSVARRTLANRRRSASRHLRLVDRMRAQPVTVTPGSDKVADGDPELYAAMAKMTDDDRELLRLWAWEQLEPREIAVVLDTTSNAVSLRLRKAKARLVDEMSGQNPLDAGHISNKHAQEM